MAEQSDVSSGLGRTRLAGVILVCFGIAWFLALLLALGVLILKAE